jgi:hypothetical protein
LTANGNTPPVGREQLCAVTAQFRHKVTAWADQEQAVLARARTDLISMANAVDHAAESGAPLAQVAELVEELQVRAFAAMGHGDLTKEFAAAFPGAARREGEWADG